MPVSAWYLASPSSVSAWNRRQRFLSPSAWYLASYSLVLAWSRKLRSLSPMPSVFVLAWYSASYFSVSAWYRKQMFLTSTPSSAGPFFLVAYGVALNCLNCLYDQAYKLDNLL